MRIQNKSKTNFNSTSGSLVVPRGIPKLNVLKIQTLNPRTPSQKRTTRSSFQPVQLSTRLQSLPDVLLMLHRLKSDPASHNTAPAKAPSAARFVRLPSPDLTAFNPSVRQPCLSSSASKISICSHGLDVVDTPPRMSKACLDSSFARGSPTMEAQQLSYCRTRQDPEG